LEKVKRCKDVSSLARFIVIVNPSQPEYRSRNESNIELLIKFFNGFFCLATITILFMKSREVS
jgi:hypothetical protein